MTRLLAVPLALLANAVCTFPPFCFNISGLPGITDPVSGTTTGDAAVGLYKLHQFGLGLDAWGTKHVRLSVNYFMNYLDGDAPNLKKNFFMAPATGGQRAEHELLFRAGINL